jgi:hypothetical protein
VSDRPDALEQGRAAFNRGEYFLAHELWEEVWREVGDVEQRTFVQGLIQIAAGLHHLQKHRPRPAIGLLRKGLEKLSPTGPARPARPARPASYARLRVELLLGQVARLLVDLDAPGPDLPDSTHLRL